MLCLLHCFMVLLVFIWVNLNSVPSPASVITYLNCTISIHFNSCWPFYKSKLFINHTYIHTVALWVYCMLSEKVIMQFIVGVYHLMFLSETRICQYREYFRAVIIYRNSLYILLACRICIVTASVTFLPLCSWCEPNWCWKKNHLKMSFLS